MNVAFKHGTCVSCINVRHVPGEILFLASDLANVNVLKIMFGRCYCINLLNIHQNLRVICNSYTMGCPPVRGDNPRALASGLSYVQVDKHGITILCHLHQCRPCTP